MNSLSHTGSNPGVVVFVRIIKDNVKVEIYFYLEVTPLNTSDITDSLESTMAAYLELLSISLLTRQVGDYSGRENIEMS